MDKWIAITPDEEFPAEEFWEAVQVNPTAPEELKRLRVGEEVIVSRNRAEKIRAWAEKVPGYAAGPIHAPEALVFRELNTDTEYRLTTEHSMSSYGIPVLVDTRGKAYGRGDTLPDGRPAAEVYEELEAQDI